jgi:hypothetical protein
LRKPSPTLADGIVEESELRITIARLEAVIQECASLKYLLEDLSKKRKRKNEKSARRRLSRASTHYRRRSQRKTFGHINPSRALPILSLRLAMQESLRILIALGTTDPAFNRVARLAKLSIRAEHPDNADIRVVLKSYAETLKEKDDYTLNAANAIEGFQFKGSDAERR